MTLAGLLVAQTAIAQSPSPPSVPESDAARVRADSGGIVYPGGTIDLTVEAVDVTDLGATTLVVGYDPAVLSVADCQRSRDFDVGLCNTEYDRDGNGQADAVRFNLVSIDGVNGTEADPLALVTITFQAIGDVGSRSAIEINVLTFTDTDAIPIPVTAENGWIDIGQGARPTPEPVNYLPSVGKGS